MTRMTVVADAINASAGPTPSADRPAGQFGPSMQTLGG